MNVAQRPFGEIDTPAVLVDLDQAEANIDRYQRYCDEHGLKLRPHIKTHKLPQLAKRQLGAGAVGITCQKVSEALAMVEGGGIADVLLTYNVLGEAKLAELQKLAAKVHLTVVADSTVVVDGLAAAFTDPARPLRVLVECDTGAERCGVTTPEAAVALAQRIDAAPGLHFQGLMTYPPKGDPKAAADWFAQAKELLEAAGLPPATISSGGSPDMWQAHRAAGVVTEYRPGTYVYYDRSLVQRGTCTFDDCALTILATVVSVPTEHRAIIDAGSKVITSDLLGLEGYGHVLGRPDITIDQLSEEHGRLVSKEPIGLRVGDRVRIVPNHACVVSNMLDRVTAVRGDAVEGPIKVHARGLVW